MRVAPLLLAMLVALAGALPAAGVLNTVISDPVNGATTIEVTDIVIDINLDIVNITLVNALTDIDNILPATSDLVSAEVAVIKVYVDIDNDFSTGAVIRPVISHDIVSPDGYPRGAIPGIDAVVNLWWVIWRSGTSDPVSTGGLKLYLYNEDGTLAGITTRLGTVQAFLEGSDVKFAIDMRGVVQELRNVTGRTVDYDPVIYVLSSGDDSFRGSLFTRYGIRDFMIGNSHTVQDLPVIRVDGDPGDWGTLLDAAFTDSSAGANEYGLDLASGVVAVNTTHLAIIAVNDGGTITPGFVDAADAVYREWKFIAVLDLDADGTKDYELVLNDTAVEIIDKSTGETVDIIYRGYGYTVTTELGQAFEALISLDSLPFTLTAGTTINVVFDASTGIYDFYNAGPLLIRPVSETVEPAILDYTSMVLGAGTNEVSLGPTTIIVNASAPVTINATHYTRSAPYSLELEPGMHVIGSLYFSFNNTASIQWPVKIVYNAPARPAEVLYYVKGQGLVPLNETEYTINGATITISINDTMYTQGDPLIAVLGATQTVGGELSAHSSQALLAIASLAAIATALLLTRARQH